MVTSTYRSWAHLLLVCWFAGAGLASGGFVVYKKTDTSTLHFAGNTSDGWAKTGDASPVTGYLLLEYDDATRNGLHALAGAYVECRKVGTGMQYILVSGEDGGCRVQSGNAAARRAVILATDVVRGISQYPPHASGWVHFEEARVNYWTEAWHWVDGPLAYGRGQGFFKATLGRGLPSTFTGNEFRWISNAAASAQFGDSGQASAPVLGVLTPADLDVRVVKSTLRQDSAMTSVVKRAADFDAAVAALTANLEKKGYVQVDYWPLPSP